MRRKSFTLIELVIVITILAILAAVAIPAFKNLQKQAKDTAIKGVLGAMRLAIKRYQAVEIASGRQPGAPATTWPDNGCPMHEMEGWEQQSYASWVMENGNMPDNPWAKGIVPLGRENHVTIVQSGPIVPKGTLTSALDTGWFYEPRLCDIWANTAENDGTPSVPNENNCATNPTTENCF